VTLKAIAYATLTIAVLMLVATTASAQDAPFVRDVFDRINGQRTPNGLKACTYDQTLEKAAQAHAEWMARQRKMDHLQPPPASFEEHRTCNHHPVNRAINAGYLEWDEVFTAVQGENGMAVVTKADANEHIGEIIAAAWGGGHPASHTRTIVDGWMKSPGHRKEILTKHYKEMGVGVACTPDGKDTFWCVMFGDPTGK
jgi:uncharacterized protein YkwD